MSGSTEAGSPQTDGGITAPTDADTAPVPVSAPPIEAESAPPSPAPPTPEEELAERDALLTHGSRALALGVLLGAAFLSWTQLAFRSPWLDELVIDNTLGPDVRKRLLYALVLGAVLGAAGAAGAVAWFRR